MRIMSEIKRVRTFQDWVDEQMRLYGVVEGPIQLEVGPDEVFKRTRKKKNTHLRYYNVVRYFILLVSRGGGYT